VKPQITLNLGFTYSGLQALDLPTRTLRLLPDEFIDGMGCRAHILGDVGASAPDAWDAAWKGEKQTVHVWISLNAGGQPDGTPLPVLQQWTDQLIGWAKAAGGVELVVGHGADGKGQWQDSAAIMLSAPDGTKYPCPLEHFGFTDGISDPVFKGQFAPEAEKIAAVGGGKIAEGPYDQATSWSALEAGEFLLGHVDEGQEVPVATQPAGFARNGTFLAWRKLRENVDAFDAYVAEQAALWAKVNGVSDKDEAVATVRAKIAGRWDGGIPLMAAPTYADNQRLMAEYADCLQIALRKPRDDKERARLAQYDLLLTGFRYGDDPDGAKCPLGAHVRRANPRDMLDPLLSPTLGSSNLTKRRRFLRRGLPYQDPTGEKGVIFMAVCSSLFRQFEFVQQQWINYGLDFDAGNDSCPLVGVRPVPTGEEAHPTPVKHVVPGAPGQAPFIAAGIPQFVDTRGGDYFFLPSMTAIRMIAMGTVDPT
jgi:Dyp-type peroxidase family